MTGDDFIALAGNLAVNTGLGTHEARYRSAVSRAYYGAYHLASDFLMKLGTRIPRSADAHAHVYRLLWTAEHFQARQAARLLTDLRRARNRADYDLSHPSFQDQDVAIETVEAAHEVRSLLQACGAEPLRSEIQARLAERQ